MANIPTGVIYIWTGNNADIPTGWERVTALDGKYPKGAANGVDPNVTGGSATHQHTGTTHSHADSHTHNLTISTVIGSSDSTGTDTQQATVTHNHGGSVTTTAINGGGLSNISCTYSAISNDPPYYTVIFITPTNGASKLPNLGVYLYDGSDSKDGHYLCDGNNSTPNLANKYLKGAANDANAGATGGSTTNVHDLTHTHTVASHYHTATTAAAILQGEAEAGATGWAGAHTHVITTNETTSSISGTPQLTTTETVEPAYKKLLTVQNRTGHSDIRLGMIGMWLGTLSSIPANYYLCDGNNGTQDMRGKHLKSTATTGEVGNTGGSNTHTHSSQNHTHTATGTHTHSVPNLTHPNNSNETSGTSQTPVSTSSYHTVTCGNSTSVYANAATAADEQNNEPEYRTVAFIKLKSLSARGAFLLNML